MTRLDRYVLSHVAAPLALSVAVVVGAVFLVQARRLAAAALGLSLTAEDAAVVFVAALPPFLVLALPIAVLLAVLVGLGRLAQDREVTALLAAGASPLRIARAALWLGALVSALGLPLAHFGEPLGLRALERRLVALAVRNLSSAVQPGRFHEGFTGATLYAAGRAPDGALQDVLLFDERDPARPYLVLAERGHLRPGPRGVELSLERGEAHLARADDPAGYDRLRFDTLRAGLDAGEALSERTRWVSPVSSLDGPDMLRVARDLGPASPRGRRYEKTYWRRFAVPLMAFVFAVIGAAVALSGRTRGESALLGLGAVLGYYVLSRLGDLLVVEVEGTAILGAFGPALAMLALGAGALGRARGPR